MVNMAISNELSSDIAAALIAAKEKDPGKLLDLKELLIEVHSTLQQMTEQSRAARALVRAATKSDQVSR